jgi:hypothetical protein
MAGEPWELNWTQPDSVPPAAAPSSRDSMPSPPISGQPVASEPWEMDFSTAKAPAAPTTSTFAHMLTDFENQGAAAGQRTTPVIKAQAPNLISAKVHEGDSGEAFFEDPKTGELIKADSAKHVILRDPDDNTLKVFARTPNTDEGVAPSLGRVLGTGMGAGNIEVSKAIPTVIGAAQRIGVDVPRAISTESPLTAFTGQVIARAPGGGPLQSAIKNSVGQLEDAVQGTAKAAGGTVDAAQAGDNYAKAIESSFKPKVKSSLDAAYDNVSALMDPNKLNPLTETQSRVADILAQRGEAALESSTGKAVDFVSDAIKRPGGLSFEGIKVLRSHLGELLDRGVFPAGMSESELRHIYSGLSEDMTTAAFNSGGARGAAALERANELNKQVAAWKDGVEKVLGSSRRSGEGVADTIIRMAGTGGGADVATLAKARSAVPPEVWSDMASTAINQLGKGRDGVFSPATFASDFRQLSPAGKALLFRSVGNSEILPRLNDVAEVSQKFVDRGKLANASGTAGHNALYTVGGAIAYGAMHGDWKEPLAAIAGIAGVNGIARLLAQPETAASVARWARVYNAAATSQSPASRVALEAATRNLSNSAAGVGIKVPSDFLSIARGEPLSQNDRPQQ